MKYQSSDKRSTSVIRQNLKLLYDKARQFENGVGQGIHSFIKYLNEMMEKGSAAKTGAYNPDAVNIMSIHQSKGLEFEVCFLADTARRHNLESAGKSLLFDDECGPAMRHPDPGGLVRCDNPLRQAVSSKLKTAMIEEEMRILYVALTRAKSRLFITASMKNCAGEMEKIKKNARYASPYTIMAMPNFISFILGAASRSDDMCFRIYTADSASTEEIRMDTEQAEPYPPYNEMSVEEYKNLFRERFGFVYPWTHLRNIPAKLTVSRLEPHLLDDREEVSLTIGDGRGAAVCGKGAPLPKFLSGEDNVTAAQRGSATHMFMQFCDFELLYKYGAEAELRRLLDKRFIPAGTAGLVNIAEIESFTKSRLFDRILSAPRVMREFRFNVSLPAWEFTENEDLRKKLELTGTDIIVQGVVDCLFTDSDGKTVLVDYKTDRLTPYELKNKDAAAKKLLDRHRLQLSYYRRICALMTGGNIDEAYIYSLHLGDAVEL